MASAATQETGKTGTRGFLPIAIETLVPTSKLEFDLHIRPDRAGAVVMFRERKYPLETEDLRRLTESGITTLYIAVADHVAYRQYLNDEVINNERVPATQRYRVLRTANRAVFQSAFRSGNVDRMVGFASQFGHQVTELVCDQGLVLNSLLPLMAHDYYTYTHVTNVCTYCVVLAGGLGIRDEDDLVHLAVGALLHDVGKRKIPPALLNHPGRFNDEQWELVRRHPTDGFCEVCLRPDLTWGQLMMIYQHHERLDGRGYPVGLVDREIHDWARICKVADVFDALSSDRPYRKAEPVDKVLDFLVARAGTEFDKEMVRCLRAMIECKR